MDSNDRERIDEAQKELQEMVQIFNTLYNLFYTSTSLIFKCSFWQFQLKEDELREAVVLIFANKQDLPNAMSASELTEKLGLQQLRNRRVS